MKLSPPLFFCFFRCDPPPSRIYPLRSARSWPRGPGERGLGEAPSMAAGEQSVGGIEREGGLREGG
jgi:hypothetical protein